MRRHSFIAVLLAAACGSVPAHAAETCTGDWSVAAPLVKKEGLATVEQLSHLARSTGAGDIVRTMLCQDNGTFTYRLVVRDAKGQLRSVSTDARKPFGR